MCSCHKVNKETGKLERVNGEFTLKTGNIGDTFRFPHESFKRQIIEMNFKNAELFAPPVENYTGMDERGMHVFHFSLMAIWGE